MRRRKYDIDISTLDISKELHAILKYRYPELNLDINSFRLVAYESYTPTVRVDLGAVLERLKRFVYINGDRSVNRCELMRIAKISLPTIDRLCKIGALSVGFLSHTIKCIEEYQEKIKKR